MAKWKATGFKINCFWNVKREDVPSPELWASLTSEGVNLPNAPNFVSLIRATIAIGGDTSGITYLKLEREGERTLFYFVNTVIAIMASSKKFELELDIWATYMLNFFYDDKNSFTSIRNHIYNEKAYQFADPMLDNIPLISDTSKNDKVPQYMLNGDATYIKYVLVNDRTKALTSAGAYDLYDGTRYFCFSKLGPGYLGEGDIRCFPVVGPSSDVTYRGVELEKNKFEMHSDTIAAFDNLNVFLESMHDQYKLNAVITLSSAASWSANPAPIYIKNYYVRGKWNCKIEGEIIFINYGDRLVYKGEYKNGNLAGVLAWTITVKYPKVKRYFSILGEIKNTEELLQSFSEQTENINNFLGIFTLPAYPNFKIFHNKTAGFLYIAIPYSGVELSGIYLKENIFNGNFSENLKTLTMPAALSKNRYSYHNNTDFNYGFLIDENGDMAVRGYLFFQNGGNIICNGGNFKSEGGDFETNLIDNLAELPQKMILSLGGPLPYSKDTYIAAIANSQSAVSNGIEQQKINYELSKERYKTNEAIGWVNSAMNFVSNGVNSAASIAGNMASGNIAGAVTGAVNGAMGQAKGIVGMVGQGLNNEYDKRAMENANNAYYAGIGAQWEDIRRNSGVSFISTNITTITTASNNRTSDVGDNLWALNPSEKCAAIINALIFKYGNINPISNIFSKLLNPVLEASYISFDMGQLQLNIAQNFIGTREEKDLIINRIGDGIRIWKVLPKNFLI